jgi:hypothetical protein
MRHPTEGPVMSRRGRRASASRYRIVVRGEFGDILSAAFPDVLVEPAHGRTVLTVTVADEQELYGLVDRLRDFAISIVSVKEINENSDPAASPG